MTTWKGFSVAVAYLSLGFVTGGLAVLLKFGGLVDELTFLTTQVLKSNAYPRYRYGAYGPAKKALLQHAEMASQVAETMEGATSRSLLLDAGMSYARLASAAEREGNTNDRDLYFGLARDQFARRGEHPTDTQLRKLVTCLDSDWDRELLGRSDPSCSTYGAGVPQPLPLSEARLPSPGSRRVQGRWSGVVAPIRRTSTPERSDG